MTITRDEWLAALNEATPCEPDALTMRELALVLGVTPRCAYDRITSLIERKQAVRVFKIATGPSGVSRRVAAYKLIDAPKKARGK